MNCLSHYYIDKNHPSPYYKLGLVLPDLVRMADTKARLNSVTILKDDSDEIKFMKQGIQKHLEVDRLFHNSDFFKHHSSQLKTILKQNGFERKELRLFFLAHILVEILLDRLILFKEPIVGENFYSDLNNIELVHVNYLLKENPHFNSQKFKEHFERFVSSRYLLSYTSTGNIFYAINRISKRVGLQPFEDRDFPAFEKSILEAEKDLDFPDLMINRIS